jgi:hypothetical protein
MGPHTQAAIISRAKIPLKKNPAAAAYGAKKGGGREPQKKIPRARDKNWPNAAAARLLLWGLIIFLKK